MLGWIGWTMVLIGTYLMGEKKISAFYWCLAAELPLVIDAIIYKHWSLLAACMAFTSMYVWNIYKWRKTDGKTN